MLSSLKNLRVSLPVALAFLVLALYLPFEAHFLGLRAEQLKNGEDPKTVLPIYGSDSIGYGILGDNLLHYGVLSLGPKAPFDTETFRTPGLPIILAIFKSIFGSYKYFGLLQILFVIGSAIITYNIGLVFSPAIGFVAAALYALDPTTLLHAMMVDSDIPFTFFLLLSVYFLFFNKEDNFYLGAFDGGLALGVATLIRPISTFLPILLTPFLYFVIRKIHGLDFKKSLSVAAVFLISFFIVLSPWLIRNKITVDVWGLSSVKDFNFFHYNIPEFVSFKKGVTPDDIRHELYAESKRLGVPEGGAAKLQYVSVLNSISHPYFWADPLGYTKWHVVKMVPFFLSSGIKNFFYIYDDVVHYKIYEASNDNLTNFLMRRQFGDFFRVLANQLPVTSEEFLWFLVFVLMFLSVRRKDSRFYVFFLLAIVFYLALPTPPVAYSRFRIPAAPFMLILAATGFVMIKGFVASKFSKN